MSLRMSILFILLASVSHAGELTLEQAVEKTLKLQADIIYSRLSADASKSACEGAAGAFDHVFSSSAKHSFLQTPLGATDKKRYEMERVKSEAQYYDLKLHRLTRSGIGFETSASILNSSDISLNEPRDSTSKILVTVNLPIYDLLLENRNTTDEKIALENSRASLNDYFFQASKSVYQTVVSYWNYLAAYEKLLIYRKSEQNTARMLSDFEKLVETGERPRADSNQIKANLFSRHGIVVAGEKELASRRYELSVAMGIPHDESGLSRPRVKWISLNDPGSIMTEDMISNAHQKRFDIRAAENLMRSAELMLESSRRGTMPDMNIFLSAEHADRAHHVSGNVINNARSAIAGITFSRPIENRSAESDLVQKGISLRQWKLNLDNAKRKAGIAVSSSLNEFTQSLKAYRYSLQAVNLYDETLKVELEKFRLGMSTVIDVINTHENYQNSLVSNIEDLRLVAVALAGVVHDSGGMVNVDGDEISVNIPALYSMNIKAVSN